MKRRSCVRRILRVICVGALAALPAACRAPPPSRLPHSVYVWQRVWDQPLRDAIGESRAFATSLRVLVLQIDANDAASIAPRVDWESLKASGLPVTAVVRIHGALSEDQLLARVPGLVDASVRQWRAAGYAGGTVEIDYDCATANLAGYARLLAQLRATVLAGESVSITALPAWRDAPELDAVLAQVDASVLQVHAVRAPDEGLFDAALARRWIADWSRRSAQKPFLVALPAYGARLKLDSDGRVDAVESEQPLPRRSAGARELAVDPREVAALIADLPARAYPNLAGFAWFRLPRDGDERAWSLRTLRAVIQGQPLRSHLRIDWPVQAGGALDLVLHSDGTLDAPLPARLRVEGDCASADGANGYTVVRDGALQFERQAGSALRAGSSRRIGWLRCADPAKVRVTLP